jgi:hypothetical protein
LPLKRKCDEIEVERCVEEERKKVKWYKKLIILDLFGNLGNFVWLPLASKCDEIEVERCVEEGRK